MKFNHKSVIFSLLLFVISACNDMNDTNKGKNEFSIKGSISFASENTLYLQQIVGNNLKKIDSISLKDKKEFELKGKLPEVGFYRLELKDKGATIFVLDNSEVQLELSGNEELPSFKIKGSKLNDNFEEIAAIQQKFKTKIDSLNQKYILAENSKDENSLAQIELNFQKTGVDLETEIKKSIVKNEKSIVSVYAASALDPKTNIDFLDTLATALQPMIENQIIGDFVKDVEKMKNIKIGGMAPNFTGDSPDGRKISLSDFKGKYLLVDFWASWCVPCRKENPNVVRLYEKFKSKNFEILSVSLDDDGTKWKNAIMADGLKWQHVSDLKGWESDFATLYSIEEIPQTYLLDKEGKILARNLRGDALEKKLDEILN